MDAFAGNSALVSWAQEMVRASMPQSGQMDSAHAARLMQEVLVALWKMKPGLAGDPNGNTPRLR